MGIPDISLSPLAQSYNGGVQSVGENPVEDEAALSNSLLQQTPITSRKLLPKKPSVSTRATSSVAKASSFAGDHAPQKTVYGPKKVTQLESENELNMDGSESHVSLEIERRLARLEESQMRIEALLANLASRKD